MALVSDVVLPSSHLLARVRKATAELFNPCVFLLIASQELRVSCPQFSKLLLPGLQTRLLSTLLRSVCLVRLGVLSHSYIVHDDWLRLSLLRLRLQALGLFLVPISLPLAALDVVEDLCEQRSVDGPARRESPKPSGGRAVILGLEVGPLAVTAQRSLESLWNVVGGSHRLPLWHCGRL